MEFQYRLVDNVKICGVFVIYFTVTKLLVYLKENSSFILDSLKDLIFVLN